MPLHVVEHPLVAHWLGILRDASTGTDRFRQLSVELATALTYEAGRNLPTEPATVQGPLDPASVVRLSSPPPLVLPILRAGMGMLPGVLAMLPGAEVAVIGIRRDEVSLEASVYADRIPPDLAGRPVVICDPMLATGGSLSRACTAVASRGAASLTAVCLLAAPEGIDRVFRDHPTVEIYVGAVDSHLDEHGFIRPGLGDAGDRLYGPG